MTNSLNESHITLAEAARLLPGRPHSSTLARWALRGVKGVRLETVKVGGRRFTSREAIERFIEAGNDQATAVARVPGKAGRTVSQHRRRGLGVVTKRLDSIFGAARPRDSESPEIEDQRISRGCVAGHAASHLRDDVSSQ
jgi:hypothetical protein